MLAIGIKTITHDTRGLPLKPHDVVVIEVSVGDNLISFDLNASFTRTIAKRMVEFADKLEH